MPDPSPIQIYDWSPRWAEDFRAKAAAIRGALGPQALRIDHIGSTAVPGLAAKPIIDIQVSVADFDRMEALAGPMAAIGYDWRPANPDLTKRYFRERPGGERTHVHIRRLGSWSEQWPLLFRDYMRAHPEEHVPYAALKRGLAEQYAFDRVGYSAAKGDHLWAAIRRADLWARDTGWAPGPSDA
jgi:GrpB-like predicted nucleotidyltransferase (UPF0157 family)